MGVVVGKRDLQLTAASRLQEKSGAAKENKEKRQAEPGKWSAYFRLLIYADPKPQDLALLATGVVLSIASGIPFPLLGVLFGQLVDDLNSASCGTSTDGNTYQSEVNDKVKLVCYVGIAYFFLVYLSTVCWNLTGERLAQRLRDRYFRSLLRQEAKYYDDFSAGEVSSRLTGDIGTIQQGTSEKVGVVIGTVSFFVAAYIIAFIKDARLGGMLVSLAPAFMLMGLVGGYYVQKYTGKMSDNVAKATAIASEALSNMTIVHAFTANARLEARFANSLSEGQRNGIRKAFVASIQSGLLYFIAYSGNALAFWQGSKTIADSLTSNSGASVGSTYTVIFVLLDASLVLSQVAPFLQIFGAAGAAFKKLEKDIDHKPDFDGTTDDIGTTLTKVSGDIELRDIVFEYPSRPGRQVLKNVSLICPAGKHTAIVGLSGSGKSTVASLITRLYDPTEGVVLLDGHNITALNVRFLRSNISLVQQEPSLLDRSILENIAHGLVNSPNHVHLRSTLMGSILSELAASVRQGQDVTKSAAELGPDVIEIVELVKQAATLADVDNFIIRLKDGYGTMVGASGVLISGGQKQRISVARALVKDPRVLIMDEATASLDSASEIRIQAAVGKAAVGRTMITIAHRLSTIREADNIIVMRDGRILEQGHHTELLLREGAYADLVALQSANKAENDHHLARLTLSPSSHAEPASEVSSIGTDTLDQPTNKRTSSIAVKPSPEPSQAGGLTGLDIKQPGWFLSKTLGPFFRPYLFVLLVAFIGAVICGSAYSASAVILGNTIGALSPCRSIPEILSAGEFYGLMYFVLAIIEFFANIASWSAFGWVSEQVLYKVRLLSFRSLLEQDIQWHQTGSRSPSLLLDLITKDGQSLAGMTGSIIGTIVSIMVNLVAAIILTHIIAWKIALVCLSVVPLVLLAGYMRMVSVTRFFERHEAAFSKSVSITVEAINSIKTVACLNLEDEVLKTYRRSLRAPMKEVTLQSLYTNIWLALAYSLSNFLYALAYWWGAKLIIAGDYSQTQFFIVQIALLVSAQLWGHMFTLAPDLSKAHSALVRISNLIDIGSTKQLSGHNKPGESESDLEAATGLHEKIPGTSAGVSISFKDVRFSYPARPDAEVLHGLNLDIAPGKFVALVGPSGAGKSTIISLLERMYIPNSGSVLIDGQDVSSLHGTSFRDRISLVPQDSTLFDGTVRFNITLGLCPGQEATDADVEKACKLANIHDTIMAMPLGYDTNCGPSGNQFSGGQKQRLTIARAIIRKPQLLLLDESSSALDAESEKLLQEGLEKASKGMTVIAIAHRLNTIRKADVIFLIEDGRVTDSGKHAELTERSESYRLNALHQAVDA